MRALVIDDSVLLREGLVRILTDAGIDVVGQAGDATNIENLVATLAPDLVILDIRMPPTNTTEGLDAALALRASHQDVAVCLLSQHIETGDVISLIENDASGVGYLLKDRIIDVHEFVQTLRRISNGESAIDPEVVSRLVQRERVASPLDAITDREGDVLALMAQGHDNNEIAERLVLTTRTVESHIASVFTKLGLLPETEGHRRVRAVLTYLEHS